MDVREAPAQRVTNGELVAGMRGRVQQHDGDRLDVRGGKLLGERRQAGGGADRAVRAGALVDREAQLRRRQRRGMGGAQPVEIGAGLAAKLDEVAEALGGDERGARRVPLEQGVGRHGRAVGEGLDLAGRGAGGGERELDRPDHANRLVVRRAQRLRSVQLAVAGGEDRVGEGPADIDAEQHPADVTAANR